MMRQHQLRAQDELNEVHERQEEDHKLILSLERRVQENNELLKGLNATRGSAPGQATGQAASRLAQATSRRAPALLEDLGVSYAQAAGSSAPHPQAASPPDLMDVDQQPLPASAMPFMSPEVQAPPTPAEILAAANILHAATASHAPGIPEGPTKPYPSWQPWHTPHYPSGSREQLYASENDLCFHCAKKVNVPGKPEIPGAHARGLSYCPVKKLQEKGPPTPIIPPPNWQPRKSGIN
ncbi:hypothetical protein WJX75_001777 [Coccomyxa subellipsoidea]|uniref:Uncharacterized protein n=1 Tax=Coccomyxa subellipsoidea TaxID=248742 RepID=A0ABR2YZ47_9CHLO